ncbi:OmpA family protein [Natroniella sulfidigena]|uniref:OmpA family protein n=1 Tax=Natroniella sulfidigena TaxID=723921 RepID=UPI00200ACE6C|nr:OmpA family protein [Natroniella sulfidigena]MCK8816801.1 OmpA family protein [Natroniella sulfidigena]
MLKKNRRILSSTAAEESFWPSFTDLLTTIILVILLFLIITLFLRQSQLYRLEQQQEELDYYQSRIEQLMGVRAEIVRDISQTFAQSDLDIEVDQRTGAIRFSGSVLFGFGKDKIQPQFKEELEEFIPEYINVILAPEYRDHVSEIVVEGHTDDVGSYMYNLELSQQRAHSVVRYILGDDFPEYEYRDILKERITANGRSESNLIMNPDGSVNRDKSRRVEFKFRLKDDEVMEEMLEVINAS